MAEEKPKGLFKKILKMEGEIGTVLKDSTNPFFKSKYADVNAFIEMVKPIINKNDLVILQPLAYVTNPISGVAQPCIETSITDPDTGASIRSTTPMTNYPDDPQKAGSTITYFRRYALQSLLLIQTEDDDGNGKKKNVNTKEQKGFTELMKAIQQSDAKTVENWKKKMEKSDKYTTVQKKEFAKAADKRLDELKKKGKTS